jgi:regulatory protein
VTKKADQSVPPGDPWPAALRCLTRRDHSRVELRDKLLERGFPPEQVEQAVARCIQLGYLDDARYAGNRARGLMAQGRAVGHRILADLRRRGVSDELAARALEEARAEHDEDELLDQLLQRRFATFNYATAPSKERRRVINFLQRRGFSLGRIMTRLHRKGSETDDENR